MSKTRGGLGRGLNALIPSSTPKPTEADETMVSTVTPVQDSPAPSANGQPASRPADIRRTGMLTVSITSIAPNPYQPRKHIDPTVLAELADSIRVHGLVQPPVVSYNPDFDENASDTDLPDSNGVKKERKARYLLIAGERRWQASKIVGLTHIPVVLKETTPLQMLELALVENIQRADLNPLEEAAAYRQLVDEFRLTQEQVAAKVGKSRTAVTNSLRLLDLPKQYLDALNENQISEGHARALLMVKRPEDRLRLLKEVITKELSVRQTEETARRVNASSAISSALRDLEDTAPAPKKLPDLEARELEEQFRNAIETGRVEFSRSKKGGKLVIQWDDDEQLEVIYRKIIGNSI